MADLKRTHYCAKLGKDDIGKEAVVAGFAQKQRNLGNLIFIDLRDRTGLIQLAFDDGTPRDVFNAASAVRSEYVLIAKGVIRARESANNELETGHIEVFITELKVLSCAVTPPFEITDKINVKEELRLKYRYLDLRRREMQRAIIMRHRIVKITRDYFDRNGFLEIETPMLIKSTPEGARDYLVPSRVHAGKFFALPQSPQLYKQLLMLSGFDRYMQITRCFRDEDLRADRQPEFTQIDLEMSFVDEDAVMELNEGFIVEVFKKALDTDIKAPFKRMAYKRAMELYGSDKPDTRFGLELCDLSDALRGCEFKPFADALASGGSVRCINAKSASSIISRKEIDRLAEYVKAYRAKGLAYTRLTEEAETSSYEKFLTPKQIADTRNAAGLERGDLLLIVADPGDDVVLAALGALRLELGTRLGLIPENTFDFLWVTDFPLFEYDDEQGRFAAKHHPFTAPYPEDADLLLTAPGECRARAYDLVLNGVEIGGGSIRISDPELQRRMFGALGMSKEESMQRFGFLLEAFSYGVPPHGGMAYGLDRLVMLMLKKSSIRDVIAFPKVQNSSDLMTQCPSEVERKSLDELHIAIKTDNAQRGLPTDA